MTCVAPIPRLLLGGSHRLHRNGISCCCARNFGLFPSQLVEFVQRGLIRSVKGINLVADYQSVLSAFLHADTNAGCGGDPPLLSLIHISEPTRLGMISYAVFCLKKKKK